MQDKTFWNPLVEQMPTEQLEALQLQKLQRQLVRVYEQSPYYKAKFDKAKLNPYKFNSFAQYGDYPFFDKDEERVSQAESREQQGHPLGMHITCDPKEVIRITSTSGTTGTPTFTGYTKQDRDIATETGSRGLWWIGIRPGDVVMHAMVLSMWIAGSPGVDLYQNFGACTVPIGTMTGVERFGQIAQQVLPKVLHLTPSYAEYLIKHLPEKAGVRADELGVQKLITNGEPGGSIKHIRERLSAGFGGAQVYDKIGATGATSNSSYSCEAHAGLHFFASDVCYVEIVDPKTLEVLPFENGVEGEIVFTGLDKECAPLIRWRDKDVVQIFTEPCACGRRDFRYLIKGRADDMLLVRGVNVYPHAIKDVLVTFQPQITDQFRIVLDQPPPTVQPPLVVRVEMAEGLVEGEKRPLIHAIESKIHNILRFRAQIELVPAGTFTSAIHKSKLFIKRYEL